MDITPGAFPLLTSLTCGLLPSYQPIPARPGVFVRSNSDRTEIGEGAGEESSFSLLHIKV